MLRFAEDKLAEMNMGYRNIFQKDSFFAVEGQGFSFFFW